MSTKRILSLVLAFVMVLGTFGTVFAAEPTNNDKVNKLIELGLVKGDGSDYRLNDTIRRDEVAAMVVRSMDLESVATAMVSVPTKFVDVKAGEWNNGYVAVAEGRGITNGTSANTFSPERQITYAEVAAMLVRVLGGLTEAEAKNAVWPATYIAKAHELGILADVSIASMTEMATRENVFEMVFNTITKTNTVVANTVEGIVIENYRTENLANDDVVIHVMKDQVQTDSKYLEAGDEFKVSITKELAAKGLDVETLLGKVVTVSFDKAGKVVDIKVNADYDYVQGLLKSADSKQIQLDGKYYTVVKNEARYAEDERIYQTYYNNEDFGYEYFIDEVNQNDNLDADGKKVVFEYARATVRNGKVLFIEAFNFEDIAPVAKDIDAKNKVTFYNDAQEGELDTLTVNADAYVITFENNEMKLGNYEDISANDVIHVYEDYKGNVTVFVRPAADNSVEGEYEEVNAAKARDAASIKVKVEGTEYLADIGTENRNPVYSTVSSDFTFYTLTEDYDTELAPFEEKEVILLLDMFGKVQLVGTETVDGSFYGIILNMQGSEFKLVKSDNTTEYYRTSLRETEYYIELDGETKESQKNAFEIGNLVKVNVKEDLITDLTLISDIEEGEEVVELDKDVIAFADGFNYIKKSAVVFVLNGSKTKAMDMTAFLKAYNKTDAEAYVIAQEDSVAADVVVFTKATTKASEKTDLVAKVTRVHVSGKTYALTLTNAKGEATRHTVTGDVYKAMLTNKDVIATNVVTVKLTKDDAKNITQITVLADANTAVLTVVAKGYNRERGTSYVELSDGIVYWLSEDANIFGDYRVGSKVQIGTPNAYDVIDLLNVTKY